MDVTRLIDSAGSEKNKSRSLSQIAPSDEGLQEEGLSTEEAYFRLQKFG